MDHGTLQDLAHFASQALEAASFAVILGAVAVSTVLFLCTWAARTLRRTIAPTAPISAAAFCSGSSS